MDRCKDGNCLMLSCKGREIFDVGDFVTVERSYNRSRTVQSSISEIHRYTDTQQRDG